MHLLEVEFVKLMHKDLVGELLGSNFAPLKSRSRAAVARRAHNPKVGGSNPPFATKASFWGFFYVHSLRFIF